jgi:hypothetical protein
LRKSSDRVAHRNAATNDARNVRGTIEGSINVDSLERHHELGRSVTNAAGVIAEHCAVFASLIETCKLNDVDPLA